jgi:hypothetical protein
LIKSQSVKSTKIEKQIIIKKTKNAINMKGIPTVHLPNTDSGSHTNSIMCPLAICKSSHNSAKYSFNFDRKDMVISLGCSYLTPFASFLSKEILKKETPS